MEFPGDRVFRGNDCIFKENTILSKVFCWIFFRKTFEKNCSLSKVGANGSWNLGHSSIDMKAAIADNLRKRFSIIRIASKMRSKYIFKESIKLCSNVFPNREN